MTCSDERLYRFDSFSLDSRKRVLLRDGEPLAIPPKIFETLLILVENNGRVVDKEDLLAQVWPDTVVEESNLTVYISSLRKTLGETRGENKYIATVPGRGYKFVGDVQVAAEAAEIQLERHTSAQIIIEEHEIPEIDEAARTPRLLGPAVAKPPMLKTRRLLMGVVGAALVAAVFAWVWVAGRGGGGRTSGAQRTLAVLPFKVLGGDEVTEYMGVGMADALITRLGGLRQVMVRPTSAVTRYARSEIGTVAAGKELGVESVLEGSIRKSGDTIRVTVQLVSVEDGSHLWADKFDEKASDVFTVEDRISMRVADALTLKTTVEEKQRLAKRYTENFEAYEEYLRGRYHWNKRTPDALKEAIQRFDRAKELDPRFALAYVGLADAYALLGFRTFGSLSPHEAMPKAKAAAVKALEIDDTLAEAHASLGMVKTRYDWDWAGAEREFKRAIELNAGYPSSHQWYSDFLFVMGRVEEAAAQYKLAQSADSSSIPIAATIAIQFYFLRQYDQAVEQGRKMIEINSNAYLGHLLQGLPYIQKGQWVEAEVALHEARITGGGRPAEAAMAYVYAKTGRKDEALKIIARFKETSKEGYVDPLLVASVYNAMGETELALEWIERGYNDRSSAMIYLKVEPRYDWLRADPRFADLIKRVGL
jgi:DNA-binding winged helix-turn-helix (wHTH) protein/TolB-like protein/tetratricopeptide (TPR) repeat protein